LYDNGVAAIVLYCTPIVLLLHYCPKPLWHKGFGRFTPIVLGGHTLVKKQCVCVGENNRDEKWVHPLCHNGFTHKEQ
jgi:hypothetical protein